jgi:prepilin-type N-terminal cleavage/methylation domain-containing protein
MRRRTRARGFTLLEVLAAVLIFVGSVAVLSRLINLGLDDAVYARLAGEATALIENRFAELDAKLIDPAPTDGESDDSFPHWTWGMNVESVGDYLYLVTVNADYERTGVTASFRLSRMFYDAEEAAEAAASAASDSTSTSAGSTAGGGS